MAMSRYLAPALVVLALAAPAAAFDEALYAALLERHTRPVADLARVRVDYAALAASPEWRRLVASLAEFILEGLHVENRLNKSGRGRERVFKR